MGEAVVVEVGDVEVVVVVDTVPQHLSKHTLLLLQHQDHHTVHPHQHPHQSTVHPLRPRHHLMEVQVEAVGHSEVDLVELIWEVVVVEEDMADLQEVEEAVEVVVEVVMDIVLQLHRLHTAHQLQPRDHHTVRLLQPQLRCTVHPLQPLHHRMEAEVVAVDHSEVVLVGLTLAEDPVEVMVDHLEVEVDHLEDMVVHQEEGDLEDLLAVVVVAAMVLLPQPLNHNTVHQLQPRNHNTVHQLQPLNHNTVHRLQPLNHNTVHRPHNHNIAPLHQHHNPNTVPQLNPLLQLNHLVAHSHHLQALLLLLCP